MQWKAPNETNGNIKLYEVSERLQRTSMGVIKMSRCTGRQIEGRTKAREGGRKHPVAYKTSNTKNNKYRCNWAHHSNIVTELWKGEKLVVM